jgi:hypothetical protein
MHSINEEALRKSEILWSYFVVLRALVSSWFKKISGITYFSGIALQPHTTHA